jgi:hypothetical protein
MLLLVGYLVEGNPAAQNRAEERSLTRVHAQVVKQVVPLGENFATAWVVAAEGARHATRLDSKVPNVTEPLCIWYVGLAFEKSLIKGFSRVAQYLSVVGNLEVGSHSFCEGAAGVFTNPDCVLLVSVAIVEETPALALDVLDFLDGAISRVTGSLSVRYYGSIVIVAASSLRGGAFSRVKMKMPLASFVAMAGRLADVSFRLRRRLYNDFPVNT